METSIYTWRIDQGDLEITYRGNEYGLYLHENNHVVAIKQCNVTVEGELLDFTNLAGKVDDFFERYLPIVVCEKNVFSVTFYEMQIMDHQISIDKTIDFNPLENKVLLDFSPTAPKYRRVIPGLNLEGLCATDGCDAKDKSVYVPRGIGRYQIPREIFEKAVCPLCNKSLPPESVTNLGFWKCEYTIDGQQTSPVSKKVKETAVAEDKRFTTFEAGKIVAWAFLDITTQSKQKATVARDVKQPQPSSGGCLLF